MPTAFKSKGYPSRRAIALLHSGQAASGQGGAAIQHRRPRLPRAADAKVRHARNGNRRDSSRPNNVLYTRTPSQRRAHTLRDARAHTHTCTHTYTHTHTGERATKPRQQQSTQQCALHTHTLSETRTYSQRRTHTHTHTHTVCTDRHRPQPRERASTVRYII